MDSELKKKWVEALRSGEYIQGEGTLRTCYDEYCCIGVLADIVDPTGWTQSGPGESYKWSDDKSLMFFSSAREMELGINGESGHLMDMNDLYHKTFEEIADYIDENL